MLRRVLWVVAALVAAWIVACLVIFVWPPAESGPPARADAVVVLSGSKRRLPPALELIRRGVAPVLAISSVGRTKRWPLGTRLCREGHYESARVVCFDAVPYSTQGEARAVERMALERGWRSIVVVTSTFHSTRARMLFGRCYEGRLSVVGVRTKPWWHLPADWAVETGKLFVQLTVQRGC